MSIDKKSYQTVMKATTLFGGVQVVHILITIARSKVIALLLGVEGMGIASLFITPLRLITKITNLGLDQSAVREIAGLSEDIKKPDQYRAITILKKLTWITVILGALMILLFSPLLSRWSFQSDGFIFSFIWLALALIFNQLAGSRLAVLQGLRKLEYLAKSNIYGAICGLIVTIPLYYYLGINGILPAIIITAGFLFFFAQYFYQKLGLQLKTISIKEALSEGGSMLSLGITLSISSFIGLLVAYLVQMFISYQSGEIAVGYYSAGIVMLNTYVGLIFKAMSSDYFPRLSAVSNDLSLLSKTVFEQAFVAILIITPIILIFIAFAPLLITLLYSKEFDPTVELVRWGIVGMLFKAVSWSVGYVILAKGDAKLFMKTTIGFNCILLLSNILGYYYGGLEGLGISLLCYFIIHFVAVQLITKMRYNFKMDNDFYSIFIICLLFCTVSFGVTYLQDIYMKYSALTGLIFCSLFYSYRLLNQKIGFATLLKPFIKKKKNE